MNCFICEAEAADIPPVGDYFERACPECGHYKISRTAVNLLQINSWSLDVELTRRWLAMHLGTGEIPLITSDRASSLIGT